MIPAQIKKQIGDELLRVAMTARLTGESKEAKMLQLLRALLPYFKTPSAHSLTALYVDGLLKFRAAVRYYRRNRIHLRKDMGRDTPFPLTFDQITNWSKLRFFGLSVHAEKDNPRSGWWLLTERGNDFLNGKIAVPKKVYTYRGHPYHPTEPIPAEKRVHILEYKQELPDFETYRDFAPPAPVERMAPTQQLFK